tara:strand:- start:1108594 stop:1109049 length:456 start_codon:yes stop_codon:yes gene_type:complete
MSQTTTQISGTLLQRTILLADDDQDIRSLLTLRCSKIEGFDCAIVAVEDALTALSCADMSPPDLIMMDVEMPGSGLAACEMLVHDERVSHIPVIILTGRKDSATIQRCRSLGAHYVHKSPDAWSNLEPIIRKELSNKTEKHTVETRQFCAW